MDALSEVLRHARFSANVTLDATAHEPWCVSVPASDPVARAHLVLQGECTLRTSHGDEATLRAGDLVFLPNGDAHLIGSNPDADATPFSSLVRTPIAGELLPVRIGRQGAATHWISLSFMCERHMALPLIASLPRLVLVDLAAAPPVEWLTDELGLVLSSSDAPFLGASAKRSRLAELVLVEALARYVQG